MKTANQIHAWLHRQPWFGEYFNRVLDRYEAEPFGFAMAMSYVSGNRFGDTISGAIIPGDNSPVWEERDRKFKEWFA